MVKRLSVPSPPLARLFNKSISSAEEAPEKSTVSFPSPPIITSLPVFPIRVSFPANPFRVLAPEFPVIISS